MRILFASSNIGKIKEAKCIAKSYQHELIGPDEVGIELLNSPEEDGITYEDNARIKAQAYRNWSSIPSIGDDSGLEVLALDSAPGIYSARYAGENAGAIENNNKLLDALKSSSNRSAKFVCVLVLAMINNESFVTHGVLEGEIASSVSGEGGFGYDPIFIPRGYSESLAELKLQNPDFETHRVIALKKLFAVLDTFK